MGNGNQLIMKKNISDWRTMENRLTIYHFVAGPKPWDEDCPEPFQKYCNIWKNQEEKYSHYRQTCLTKNNIYSNTLENERNSDLQFLEACKKNDNMKMDSNGCLS